MLEEEMCMWEKAWYDVTEAELEPGPLAELVPGPRGAPAPAPAPVPGPQAALVPGPQEAERLQGVPLADDVLTRARGAGLEAALRNLAGRLELSAREGLTAENLLEALVGSSGLVNKAKYALLGEKGM